MIDSQDRIERLLRPEVRSLSAYHVPDSKGFIKLDAMENPYRWPPETVDLWLDRLRVAEPNRYPDPACAGLKAALKVANGVPKQAELLLGNGSDEVIQILLMALNPGATVMAPEPTFVMYRQISQSLGLRFLGVPLRGNDFSLDTQAFCAAIEAHQPAIIFLAYPNNPTGNLFEKDAMDRILAVAPGLVVVDEAYAPYADASYMPELGRHDHLLVMRTLSKLGLAGLRLGFLAGHPRWIEELDKLRLPYNINVLTQISAEFALEQHAVFDAQVNHILQERGLLISALDEIPKIQVYDTHANFILIRLLQHDTGNVFLALKKAGVLVKNLHPNGGLLSQCLRITVGTPDENQRFLEVFREALAAPA
jgi:histidinol-phosphate aminotransferase